MNRFLACLVFLSSGIAVGGPVSPCYWMGQFVRCLPSGGIQMADGTVSLPGYSWAADTDTGFYRIGANNVGLAQGGIQLFSFANTTGFGTDTTTSNIRLLMRTDDTATERPTIQMTRGTTTRALIGVAGQADDIITGDVAGDMGIRANGNMFFSINDGVTAQARIDTNGDIDVGVDTGDAHIDSVEGSATTPTWSYVGDGDTGLYRSGANAIGFALNATQFYNLTTTGASWGSDTLTTNYTLILRTDDTAAERGVVEIQRGATSRGVFAVAGATNDIFNGTVEDDLAIRGNGNIRFSADSTTLHATIANNGGVTITETTGGTGNVPHICVRRTSSSAASATCSVTCSAGEGLTGGGCVNNTAAQNLQDSYPSDGDTSTIPTTWSCTYALAAGTCTARAICCVY